MHHPCEFMYEGMLVGCFEQMPLFPGLYRYEPYRGPGHYEMQMLHRSGGGPRCYYDSETGRVSFTVRDCPKDGVLELYDIETSL